MSDHLPDDVPWEEWYCSSCKTLLFRVVPVPGLYISIRCRRCGAIIERRIQAIARNGVNTDDMKHLLHRIDDKLDLLRGNG